MSPLAAVSLPFAQTEPDLEALGDSGISEVGTGEWILAGAVFVTAIVLASLLRRGIQRLLDRSDAPHAIGRLVGRAAAFVVVVLGFFYALSSIDVQVGPLLGGLGIAGIALAFAAQEILANFASGIILQTRRPFRIGDQIVSNEYEGVVEDVTFRAVQVRTFDGETVYVPNSMVLQNPITNWTRTPTRRTSLIVAVAYDTDLALAQRVMREAVEGLDEVEARPEPEAFVYEFGESSINFEIRFWHGATIIEMWRARDAAAQAIKRALDDAKITIPFPQRTLWFGPGNTKLRVADESGDGSRSVRAPS